MRPTAVCSWSDSKLKQSDVSVRAWKVNSSLVHQLLDLVKEHVYERFQKMYCTSKYRTLQGKSGVEKENKQLKNDLIKAWFLDRDLDKRSSERARTHDYSIWDWKRTWGEERIATYKENERFAYENEGTEKRALTCWLCLQNIASRLISWITCSILDQRLDYYEKDVSAVSKAAGQDCVLKNGTVTEAPSIPACHVFCKVGVFGDFVVQKVNILLSIESLKTCEKRKQGQWEQLSAPCCLCLQYVKFIRPFSRSSLNSSY